jgi:predicted permease
MAGRGKQQLLKPHLWLIALIGVIVPRRLRTDWRQEWESELRHREELLDEWDKLNWRSKLDLIRRSLGAFWDALWMQSYRWEDEMIQDIRFSLRMLIKNPGFTFVAVLTLALGIGANTAIFSLIDTVLLKQLPVAQPEQLFFVNNVGTDGGGGAPPYPCFEQFRDHTSYLSGIAALSPSDPRLTIDGQIEQVRGQVVSGNYFTLLGVNAIAGRVFNQSEDVITGQSGPQEAVAVLGYNYWQRRFGLDPAVIGKVVYINKTPITIVGVAPPGFHGLTPGRDEDIYMPIMLAGSSLFNKSEWWLDVVGRLKDGATLEQARAELDAIFQAFMSEGSLSPDTRKRYFDHIEFMSASRGLDSLRRHYSRPLLVLMVVVGLVLLIACANVANLLLTRASVRYKEFAVRLALGASRFRILRQMLTESLLLVGMGGLLGLLLARWSGTLLVNFFATGQRQISLSLQLDSRVLLAALGISLLTGVIFSLTLGWKVTRFYPSTALKENSATASSSRARMRLGKTLVVVQTALSLLLMIGAGLFLRSLHNLRNLDAGFRPEGVLTMQVDPGARQYPTPQLNAFWQDVLSRVQATPGVQRASLSVLSPLDGRNRGVNIEVPDFIPGSDQDKGINLNHVSPDYFSTIGIAILQGRPFDERDNQSSPKVALLNETAARFYFGEKNPIGARIKFQVPRIADPIEIVGIVRDSRHTTLRDDVPRLLYLPTTQPMNRMGRLTLAVHTAGDPAAIVTPITSSIREMGSDILITNVITLDDQVNQTLLQERLVSSLSSLFGILAMVLACIGLYGVVSYDVAHRTHEIGIRLALGAQSSSVLRMVLGEMMILVVTGLGIGLVAALATTKLVESLLFGLTANDPLTIVLATLLLLAVAIFSGWLPARRATKVDPMMALRHE